MSGYQHLTPVGEGSTHILIYNPVSGYQHLTAAGEGSTHILTYNPVSGFTHISDISDQFLKKKLILSHISQSKVYTKYNNLLGINNFFSNTEAYQRSQYQIEHKSKDA